MTTPTIPWPRRIRPTRDQTLHPDHGGWRKFLAASEVRDQHDGVIFFGRTNCNYILFPSGRLLLNYGYHGRAFMNRVREIGAAAAEAQYLEFLRDLARLRRRIRRV